MKIHDFCMSLAIFPKFSDFSSTGKNLSTFSNSMTFYDRGNPDKTLSTTCVTKDKHYTKCHYSQPIACRSTTSGGKILCKNTHVTQVTCEQHLSLHCKRNHRKTKQQKNKFFNSFFSFCCNVVTN